MATNLRKILTRIPNKDTVHSQGGRGQPRTLTTEFSMQFDMFGAAIEPEAENPKVRPFKTQLLKWIGNKQRFAHEIAGYFPDDSAKYYEPFLGSGAVLGTWRPKAALASDVFPPLMEVWQTLKDSPEILVEWYAARYDRYKSGDPREMYEAIKADYNSKPNGGDLVFLCRSCYGGVVRFRRTDGYMSTPCGVHHPITPESFRNRVRVWHS